MTLVSESSRETDFGQGDVRLQHLLARGANAQAMDAFSDTLSGKLAEHSREMHRMNARFPAQILESEQLRIIFRQFLGDSPEPGRPLLHAVSWHSRNGSQQLRQQAIHGKVVD